MKSYYESNGITIYHGDCLEISSTLKADFVLTDPPYGISLRAEDKTRAKKGRPRNYDRIIGDDKPFDPSPWIRGPAALFGANYFSDRLPPTSGWLVWDKMRPHDLDQATAELVWTNFVKGVRVFRFLWHGCMRDSREPLVHPTQKPVALMEWIINLRWTPPGTILDPYMGSGTTLVASKRLGRKAIGVEVVEKYCEISAKRLDRTSAPLIGLEELRKCRKGAKIEGL